MLLGEVVYKVGQKRRLALPKKFRQQLGDRLVVTRGYEGCLVMVSEAEWQSLIAEVDQASFLDINARASARFLLGVANEVELDAQGAGTKELETDRWTIGGDSTTNILNRSIIVHGGVDDFKTQPTGNAGNRLGCGIINKK